MKKVFEHIVQILGTNRESPLFEELASELGEPAEPIIKHKLETVYLFRRSGFQISFDESREVFWHAFIHFGSALALSGKITQYHADLPNGVEFGDTRSDVEEKFGVRPQSSQSIPGSTSEDFKDLWEVYDFSQVKVTFIFRMPAETLASVAIEL